VSEGTGAAGQREEMKFITARTVLVPFEWNGKTWEKRDDLPRFIETMEVITYLTDHPEISSRKDPASQYRMVPVRLEWREHSEPDLIREWIDGVGTPAFNVRKR
jgi:hypothetical protein